MRDLPLSYLITLFACFFMTGLIWLVQRVHYPTFRFVAPGEFAPFARFHQRRISAIVGPVMLVEILSAAAWAAQARTGLAFANVLLNAAQLLFTFFVSVPLHRRLTDGYSEEWVARLIATNWVRTLAWTARAALLATVFF